MRPVRTHCETKFNLPNKDCSSFLLQTCFASQSNTNCEISANLCSSIDIVKLLYQIKFPQKTFLCLADKPFRPIPQNHIGHEYALNY